MTKFTIENESQERTVRILQSEARKLSIPFTIADDSKTFQTDKDCFDYLFKNQFVKMIEGGKSD